METHVVLLQHRDQAGNLSEGFEYGLAPLFIGN